MYRRARENPSFSSSLLDEIYRSIDKHEDEDTTMYRETTKEKHNFSSSNFFQNERECERVVIRRKSTPDFKRSGTYFNSSSSQSSSGSSCSTRGFSSSETESVYGLVRPKPIRTDNKQRYEFENPQIKPKNESKFVKTKSRAMKIYGDLKKVKQPISPGGRLATFLNSIFATNHTKSTKVGIDYDMKSKSVNASTCSSASSFSRSCLSNSSSRSKLSNNKIRSVRFYPVSVIVDEDCQPCGHKSLYESQEPHSNLNAREKTRKIEEAARNLLRNYQKKVECDHEMSYEHDDDDDDDASHASSDLFELENFSSIGTERYGDELPVYGTTYLDMNIL